MTHRILKSAAAGIPDFDVAVAAHAAAIKHWRAHMARVKEDEANGVTGIEKHAPYDRPIAHQLVAAAVNENDDVDFEIVDDPIEQQKAELMAKVVLAEQAALASVLPPEGKRRYYSLLDRDIAKADEDRAAEMLRTRSQGSGFLGLLKKPKVDDIAAVVAEQRPAEDTRHLEEQAERRRRVDEIQRTAAKATHDIEDLTSETIGAWAMPDFN